MVGTLQRHKTQLTRVVGISRLSRLSGLVGMIGALILTLIYKVKVKLHSLYKKL